MADEAKPSPDTSEPSDHAVPPSDLAAVPPNAADLYRHRQELGLFGSLFGSRENAPTNIAGIGLLLFCVMWIMMAIVPLPAGADRADLLKSVSGLILATLGFLFGAASSRR